ncbi:hypothetical protein Agub_g11066 [Astrephomene gubernaculifera]|uniref:Uncharacterized protein n=1 Tax=Astrephomene gubernaculifera TaxID=47775 RepID=A0AAD3HQF6_9CHLO|nr:hypothetical protein Agub_g11066 [Astrephomene gubernaculifera]
MSEPSPKRLKADDSNVAQLKQQDGDLATGGLGEGAPETMEERWAVDLEECQRALDKVNDEASDRVLAVEQEYNKKRRPIYTQRASIIKNVPLFWQRTLSSHPTLADQLTDDDTAVLEHLTELEVVDFDDIKSGFKIVLNFSSRNPFFSNTTLTKSFHYGDDNGVEVRADVIEWNQGFEPSSTGLPGDPGRSYMFFLWLGETQPIGEGTPDEISEILKEEIWPNPLKYFMSELPLLEAGLEGEELDEGAELEEGAFEEEAELGGEGEEFGGAEGDEGAEGEL